MPYGPHDAWLLPFLAQVRARPAAFLRDERVSTLDTFIFAYTQAREDLGMPPFGREEAAVLPDFEHWLAARLRDTRQVAWPTLVASVDPGDQNVLTFFRLFEEFLTERPDLAAVHARVGGWPRTDGDRQSRRSNPREDHVPVRF